MPKIRRRKKASGLPLPPPQWENVIGRLQPNEADYLDALTRAVGEETLQYYICEIPVADSKPWPRLNALQRAASIVVGENREARCLGEAARTIRLTWGLRPADYEIADALERLELAANDARDNRPLARERRLPSNTLLLELMDRISKSGRNYDKELAALLESAFEEAGKKSPYIAQSLAQLRWDARWKRPIRRMTDEQLWKYLQPYFPGKRLDQITDDDLHRFLASPHKN